MAGLRELLRAATTAHPQVEWTAVRLAAQMAVGRA
jgi:hypothetical protein